MGMRRTRAWAGRAWRRAAAAAMLVLAVAAADAAAQPLQLALEVSQAAGGQVQLVARLTDGQGRPVGARRVQFFVVPEFLAGSSQYTGRHPVFLGEARTNVVGMARWRWRPALSGPATVVARLAPDEQEQAGESGAAVEATQVVELAAAPPGPQEAGASGWADHRPLAGPRRLVGVVALAAAAGTWLVLAACLLVVLRSPGATAVREARGRLWEAPRA